MTEQESPAAPRPDAHHIRAWRPRSGTDPREPRPRAQDADPQVGRVAACALGLAYARREDVEGLQELVAIADADEQVLAAARERLAVVDVVDDATRRRADALLYTAVGHLDRLLA
jgi:hypothetical protein